MSAVSSQQYSQSGRLLHSTGHLVHTLAHSSSPTCTNQRSPSRSRDTSPPITAHHGVHEVVGGVLPAGGEAEGDGGGGEVAVVVRAPEQWQHCHTLLRIHRHLWSLVADL